MTRRLKKAVASAAPPPNLALPSTQYEEEHYWGRRTIIPVTDETPHVAVCCNEHRSVCIRILVGRKKTAYIPMDAAGLHIVRCGNDQFRREWPTLMVEYTPQVAAQVFLRSTAATYYISEKARSHLEEISKSGTTTVKENDMTDVSKKQASKATKPKASAAKAAKPKAKPAAGASKGKAAKPKAKNSIYEKEAALKTALKKGSTVIQLVKTLGICKKSVVKLLAKVKAKSNDEGVFKLA